MGFDVKVLRIGGSALTVFTIGALAACSGGSGNPVSPILGAGGGTVTPTPVATTSAAPGSSPTPKATASPTAAASATPIPTATPTSSGSTVNCTAPTVAVPSAGGTVTSNTGNYSETFASGAFASTANVVLNNVPQSSIPAPLYRARFSHVDAHQGRFFTAGAGNTFVVAFCNNFGGATPASAPTLNGAAGVVPAAITAGTQLNIALYNGTSYTDVGTALVGSGGTFTSTIPTAALPGVVTSGTYLVYEPAQGTNTAALNLGFALVADDGTGFTANGLQFVQLEDGSGNALPTPTTTFFPVAGGDLDGQSLTPDAQHGAAVDGGNTVYFFSGIPQHTFTLSPTTVDVTNYGGDGDSIVSLPGGDEAVVSGDDGAPLAVISGILAGTPAVADSIANPNMDERDGLVISNDGKTMLSRGGTGTDVYQVAPVAAHAGSTGTGTTSFSFTKTTTLTTVPAPQLEDGRDDMAISPSDGSRAVIAGMDSTSGAAEIALVTGLPTATATVSSLHLRLPQSRYAHRARTDREPSAHRRPFVLQPTGVTQILAVTITPDGTTAFVSTDVGIVTVTGVNTGTLVQGATTYSPTITAGTTTCPLVSASSIGVLPDGKYLIADVNCNLTAGTTDSTQGSGVIVTIPIGAGKALGAPVGQLNNVVTPNNDQIIFH